MSSKKTPVDLVVDLMNSEKQVQMCDVAEIVFKSIDVCSDNSNSFKRLKRMDEGLFNGVVNTLVSSIAANLSTMGMEPKQVFAFLKNLDTSTSNGIGLVIQEVIDKHEA